MSLGFVDTGAWIALIREADHDHAAARRFYRALPRAERLLTTNYVLAETYTWLRYRVNHRTAITLHGVITAARRTGLLHVEWMSPERHDAGWRIFERYDDQLLSFADCASAVVARELRADYVFSFDHDFSVLGFDVRPGP